MIKIFRLALLAAGLHLTVLAQGSRAASPSGDKDDARPSVAFFLVGNDRKDPWTTKLRAYAEAAAEDFSLDLEIHFSPPGRQEIRQSVSARLSEKPLPDYALISNNRGVGEEMLRLFNDKKVCVFLFNSGLTNEEHDRLGAPGETLPYWIGELTPDDADAGYKLAKYLIARAREKSGDPAARVNVVGITGSYANPVANDRVDGLKRAVAEEPNAFLLQTVSARWLPELAAQKYEWLTKRYQKIDVVWAANDQMAMGVVKHLDGPAQPVVGGMDWTAAARDAIEHGRMAASMGGHFIDVAYALAEIATHARRSPHERANIRPIQKSFLSLLTQDGLAQHQVLFDDARVDEFDFAALLAPAGNGVLKPEISIDAFMDSQKTGAEQ